MVNSAQHLSNNFEIFITSISALLPCAALSRPLFNDNICMQKECSKEKGKSTQMLSMCTENTCVLQKRKPLSNAHRHK